MRTLVDKIKNSIGELSSSTLVVGVSGGVDSVVLLHVLHKLGVNCIVAHCNFHLRAECSNADEQLVRDIAKQLGYAIEVVDFDTEMYAKERKLSIEMAARTLRYEWFEQIREKYQSDYIAVAHNANDSVETFFLNLSRGTGIKGLLGISRLRDKILRPMIDVSRQEIEEYAVNNNLLWHNDHTNDETVYYRNKIRHDVLPVFNSLNQSFLNTMKNNMQHLKDVQDVFEHYSNEAYKDCIQEIGERMIVDVDILKTKVSPKTLLFHWMQQKMLPSNLIQQLVDNIDMNSGKRFENDEWIIVKDRTKLLIERKAYKHVQKCLLTSPNMEISEPLSLKLRLSDMPIEINKSPNVAMLDANRLVFPLELRLWKDGDAFVPYGMRGRKKVSDFLTSKKISVLEKDNTWVLTSCGNIVWVVGHRVDDRYAVGRDTNKILEIVKY